jgi:hypothetical protein
MRIDSYDFGEMVVDGKHYKRDLIIFQNHIEESWWRDQGHNLQWDDLAEVVVAKPTILIVGTGRDGMMKVSDEAVSKLRFEGIKMFAFRTGDAVRLFNEMQDKENERVIGAFHLTC